jgi:carbamoyltransferase
MVVGVHNGHNAAAALVCDGMLAFALQEERLTRVKNQGGLPKLTLQQIASDFPADELSQKYFPVAFGGRNLTACAWRRDAILQSYAQTTCGTVGGLKRLARRSAFISDTINLVKFRNLENELKHVLPGVNPHPTGFDHHLCHAAAAYFGWGNMDDKILVLTCDGAGDCACATVSIGEHGTLRPIARTERATPWAHSLEKSPTCSEWCLWSMNTKLWAWRRTRKTPAKQPGWLRNSASF